MTGRRVSHRQHEDADDWASADEPMTEAQSSYLARLCEQAGERMPALLTKAEASKRINELKARLERPAPPLAPRPRQ